MKENQEPGSFISNITMIDEDKNTMTSCKLLNDAEGRIALNETTLIAGEKMTDYEQELSHMIEISLQCCDQSKACYEKRFNITVEGEALLEFIFPKRSYSMLVHQGQEMFVETFRLKRNTIRFIKFH